MAGPSAAVGALPAALAEQSTSFLGREREVAEIHATLLAPGTRLLTLTGPGGVGKTRLALVAAAGLADRFPDGVVYAPLAGAENETAALQAVARAAGASAPDPANLPLEERVVAALRERSCLLLLDNLEHLPALAPRIASLLSACPGVRVLATGRRPLQIRAERRLPVEPLPLPPAAAPAAKEALGSPAVALFVERAKATDPAFALTDALAPPVAEICRRLDGLPLAIELAAARSAALGPTDLLARLDRRLSVLAGRDREAPLRHQTLRAAIAWSYDLLSADEQWLFRRLAIFPAGFFLEMAEAVAGGGGRLLVPLDVVEALMEASLLQRSVLPDGRARFAMLETVREYALDRLAAAGEEDAALDALIAWCLAYLDELRASFREPGRRPPDEVWLQGFDLDGAAFRSAVQAALRRRDAVTALRLIGSSVVAYWSIRGIQREEGAVLEASLALVEETGAEVEPSLLARALGDAGARRGDLGDLDEADAYLTRSLQIRRKLDDALGISNTLANLGYIASVRGGLDEAVAYYEESVAYRRRMGMPAIVVHPLVNLGGVLVKRRDERRAAETLTEALHLAEEAGDIRLAAYAIENLGELALGERRDRDALDLARQAHALFAQLQDKRGLSFALGARALALLRLGLIADAAMALSEALAIGNEAGDRVQLTALLESTAALLAATGLDAEAVRLLGAADAARERLRLIATPADLTGHRQTQAALRGRLDVGAYRAAWSEGRGLTQEQAVAAAIAGAAQASHAAPEPAPEVAAAGRALVREVEGIRVRLTRREIEVLRHLAEGETDREIADVLFVSAKTISSHVARILSELGVATRTAAAVRAVRFGLI
jgi:predicted ATPase/DNA-binding NarL/FixJ family response regulator